MKKIFLSAVMTALFVCGTQTVKAEDYNRLGVSYELENWNVKHGDNIALNGVGVNYIHGFGLSKNVPVYIETGVKLMAGFGQLKEDGEKYDYSTMNVSVPANVAYKFSFADGNMALTPYFGVNFKFNVLAKEKSDGYTFNLLKDIDDDGADASIFQAGWHIGLGYNFRSAYIGVEFGTDFNNFVSVGDYKISSNNFNVTLGYNF